MKLPSGILIPFFLLAIAAGAQEGRDPVLAAMRQELNRSLLNLKQQPVAPYFLSYQLTDNRAIQISGAFGALTASDDQRTRWLDVDLRVGDYALDNTHPMRGGSAFPDIGQRFDSVQVPLENEPVALRTALWYETDKRYKQAREQLAQVKTNVQVKVEQEDKSGDFSQAPPASYYEPEAAFAFDRAAWEEKLRRFTVPFSKYPEIYDGSAHVSAEVETRRYVNSDGSEIQTSLPLFRLWITAMTKADDGMELPLHETYMAFTAAGLPDDATVLKDVEEMIRHLLALRQAPVADAYTGPAILSGRASAVFFHEIFGHRIEGQRQKEEDEAQTFKKKVNQAVLPPTFSVYSDPTLKRIGNEDLVGYYPYDDEGVKARRVTVVANGVLKNFLMSRSPIEGFAESNGHGRRQQGYPVTARQSNLLVEASKEVSRAQLKKMLIEQVKAAGKPYGLFFDDIEGGFTFTQRELPNAFNVMPTMVYRIYPDGREELVRGVDLIGTPLIAFSKIAAADDEVGVFNGICGAESGWVPVSAVSPGILVQQIETQRKEKSQERPPVLPPPSAGKGGF
jgi:predicted Zn-dependent protease